MTKKRIHDQRSETLDQYLLFVHGQLPIMVIFGVVAIAAVSASAVHECAWREGYVFGESLLAPRGQRVIVCDTGLDVPTNACERLYHQCEACGGARVCRRYCDQYQAQCADS